MSNKEKLKVRLGKFVNKPLAKGKANKRSRGRADILGGRLDPDDVFRGF